jgi:transposase-like protein
MSTNYDQHLTCADCNRDFLWSAREQDFYREKGFQPPKRCKDCARARKEQRGGRPEGRDGNR